MEDDNSWILDSFVCFLNGPIWNAPMQNFIEEKSLIFEPNEEDCDDYKTIYEEFKNLVNFILKNFIEDIGISQDQFENAFKEGTKCQVPYDHNIFEQIWAVDDYDLFKRMMIQRNVELQLQALELIEQKYGITPQSFLPKTDKEIYNHQDILKLEEDVLNEVAKNFPTEDTSAALEVENILEEKKILEKTLQEAKEKAHNIEDHKLVEKENSEKTNEINEEQATFNQETENKVEIDELELKKRQEYLRSQRDKLVALKKEARRKQLNAEDPLKNQSSGRPKSAKAAEAVLRGVKPKFDSQQLQIRKTLAERLKTEVVDLKK